MCRGQRRGCAPRVSLVAVLLLLAAAGPSEAQLLRRLTGSGPTIHLPREFREGALDVLHSASKTVAGVPEKVPQKIGSAIDKVENVAHDAKDTVKNATEKVLNSTLEEVNDCLGLGMFSSSLESFMKKDENGTNAQDVRFYISTRHKPHKDEVIIGDQFGLEWTDFEIQRNTVIIVHGFLSYGNETWITDMTDAFLELEDVNVIAVDWSDGGNTYNYYKAVINTRTTGDQIATFFGQITNYTLEHGGPERERWGSIHCVGHSLGAHICGYAANEIKRRGANWTISRITGLDPAQPCFRTADLALKLDKDDAPYVDVIHTNGRLLLKLGLGLPHAIGHADFFPNGGKQQPGCGRISFYIPGFSIPRESIMKAICSHGRSYLYFTESIRNSITKNCTFWAHPWDRKREDIQSVLIQKCHKQNCSEMGIDSDKHEHTGSFFALTAADLPYCYSGHWNHEQLMEIIDNANYAEEIANNDTDTTVE